MFFINWYECWTKLYILSNHFKESTGLFMCILGLNSPGFKFHLTTKVVIAIIQSEATLPRKSLLCQVWPIFVNGFGLVVFSKNSECFSLFPERSLFCHLPRDHLRKILKIPRTYYIFIKAHWVSPPIQNTPPPPYFCSCKLLAIICCKTRMDELSMNNTLVYLECIWCYFHQINRHFNLPVYLVF